MSRREPALDADTDKDVGFTGLVYSAEEEAFFAVSDFGALWRIDPLLSRAKRDKVVADCDQLRRLMLSPIFEVANCDINQRARQPPLLAMYVG